MLYNCCMNILIASNGNYSRHEVKALARVLEKQNSVVVATMSEERSYSAMAFSFQNVPIRVETISYRNYEFYTTPADAMSIMLGEILSAHPPDLVICGISNSTNMGPDIYSSSHVGMAIQAASFGVPAVVIGTEFASGGNSEDALEPVITFIEKNLAKFAGLELPPYTFLNINVPRVENYQDLKGIKFTGMGRMNMRLEYVEKTDPKGKKYYWAKRAERKDLDKDNTPDDKFWYDQGYVTITPISYDSTDFDAIDAWGKVVKKITDNK